jgi:hypothetical protein
LKLTEIADEIIIDPRKLTEYALDPDSARGRDKAIVFERVLGYTIDNYDELLQQLMTSCPQTEATEYRRIEQGILYQVDVIIFGKESAQAVVRTGWLIRSGTRAARLTTAFVKRR